MATSATRGENSKAPRLTVVRLSARVSPMLFGIGDGTKIVCPNRLWQSLNEDERQAFLAHEVAHYLRHDHWVRWIEWLVTTIYWWCPLVYFARRELERHEEVACDAWAISYLHTSPRTYAEALLSVVDFLSETQVGTPRLASRMQPADSDGLVEQFTVANVGRSEHTIET